MAVRFAGHSHAANIKHRKDRVDAKRSESFSRARSLIVAAAKVGGIDPKANAVLQNAISHAKSINMPKDKIQAALQTAEKSGSSGNQATFELKGIDGFCMMIECMTDNKSRTLATIRKIVKSAELEIVQPGTVAYAFKKVAKLIYKSNGQSSDDFLEEALIAGATEYKIENDNCILEVEPSTLSEAKGNLEESGISGVIPQTEITPVAGYIQLDADTFNRYKKVTGELGIEPEIFNVIHNADFEED
eukprot:TRINITY_DN9985_c0_g1_i1.p1 TRINITY_DN9985_c0_g1~~TRINITY_DN9985_c0_g1_i1.p1  ORF type:complete len:277 (-),score=78.57 TRINITY_DN9985_c0_g1_i1:24-761(-)